MDYIIPAEAIKRGNLQHDYNPITRRHVSQITCELVSGLSAYDVPSCGDRVYVINRDTGTAAYQAFAGVVRQCEINTSSGRANIGAQREVLEVTLTITIQGEPIQDQGYGLLNRIIRHGGYGVEDVYGINGRRVHIVGGMNIVAIPPGEAIQVEGRGWHTKVPSVALADCSLTLSNNCDSSTILFSVDTGLVMGVFTSIPVKEGAAWSAAWSNATLGATKEKDSNRHERSISYNIFTSRVGESSKTYGERKWAILEDTQRVVDVRDRALFPHLGITVYSVSQSPTKSREESSYRRVGGVRGLVGEETLYEPEEAQEKVIKRFGAYNRPLDL